MGTRPKDIRIIEGPELVRPINAEGGLYMVILANGRLTRAEIGEFCSPHARKHGWDPNGRATVGMPCSRGIGSVTYAVWFHDMARA